MSNLPVKTTPVPVIGALALICLLILIVRAIARR